MDNSNTESRIQVESCDEFAKQLAIIGCGLEEMSATARSTAFFWETEEAAVLREAFLDFKDEAERLLLTLKKLEEIDAGGKNSAQRQDACGGVLDADAIF